MAENATLEIKRQVPEETIPFNSIFQCSFVASPTLVSASRSEPHGHVGGDAEIVLRMDARKPQHRGTRRGCHALHVRGSHRAGQHQGWQDWSASQHPGGNPGANLKSTSHRCHPILVAFVWELTEETIDLPLGCLQGGFACPCFLPTPSNPPPQKSRP